MANLSNINGKFVVEQTTGYVGVGTTDPNYPIEVLNASAEIALNASGGSIYRLRSDSTDSFRINKNGVGDRLVIDGSGNSTFSGTVQATQFTATNGLNYLKRDTDASLQLRSENTRSGLFITKPATNTIMGSALVLADESYRFGTANYYHQVMLQDGNTYFNQNVGIGTTGPSSKLNVDITSNHDGIVLSDSGTWIFQVLKSGSATNTSYLSMASQGVTNVRLHSNGDSYLNGGNVGIGTTLPIGNFNISGGTGDAVANDVIQTFSKTTSTGNVTAAKIKLDHYNTNHSDLQFLVKTTASSAENDAYYTNALTILGRNANVGIGTDSPTNLLSLRKDVAGGDVAIYLQNYNSVVGSTDETVSIKFAHGNDGGSGYVGAKIVGGKEGDFESSPANVKGFMSFYTNEGSLTSQVEQMRINGDGNVGIGVTPNDWDPTITALQIDAVSISAFLNNVMLISGNAYYDDTANAYKYINDGFASQLTVNNSGNFEFKTAGSGTAGGTVSLDTKIKILNNGNVGIGTTGPSQLLHVNSSTNNPTGIGLQNSERYYAVRSNNYSLVFSDETVGLERMRITSGGQVSLPTTALNDTRHIILTGTQGTTNNACAIGMWGNEARFSANWYYNGSQQKTVAGNGQAVIGLATGATDAECYLTFGVNPPADAAGVTERMRIDSSGFGYFYNNFYLASAANQGNLFFGTADNQYNIFGGGTYGYMGYNTSGYHRFLTSGTERIKIFANGRFQFSGISSSQDAVIQTNETSTGTGTLRLQAGAWSAAYGGGIVMYANAHATKAGDVAIGLSANAGSEFRVNLAGQDTSTDVLTLTRAGNMTITGTLTENSDISLKENIKPLESQLEIVNKLNPVSYNKKENKESLVPFTGKKEIGFIAQEVEEILPELVFENKEGIKSLAYANMNAILVKAIQELKADNDSLKARIETLENN